MRALVQDLGYTLRSFRKSPGFTLTAVLTLASVLVSNGGILDRGSYVRPCIPGSETD